MPLTKMIELPGTESPGQDGVAARQGQLGKLVPPESIVAVAEATLPLLDDPTLIDEVYELAGLVGRTRRRTPFTLRALVVALEGGHFAAHEGLRAILPLTPDQDLGTSEYKYRGFYQEAVVATMHTQAMNPERWDVHHLWHTTHGLLWSGAGMARGLIYAGARLNEAACEAHWFWLDGILSRRCAAHHTLDVRDVGSDTWPDCRDCDAAVERASRDEALSLARAGVRFWDHEAASVDLFLATHAITPNPVAPRVENWREAYHYLSRHERRLRSAPMRRYVETCLDEGGDRHARLPAYRDAIAHRVARLLLAPLSLDVAAVRVRQARRVLQDVAARLAQAEHLGWIGPEPFARVTVAIAALTPLAHADTHTDSTVAHARSEAWAALFDAARGVTEPAVLALGYDLRAILGPPVDTPADGIAAELAEHGLIVTTLATELAAVLPVTTRALARDASPALLARRVAADPAYLSGRGRLGAHARRALHDRPALAELARYEQLIERAATAPPSIREDLFAIDPATTAIDDTTAVRLNPSLESHTFAFDVLALFTGSGDGAPTPTHIHHGWFGGRGFLAPGPDFAPLERSLRRPRPLADLVAPGGPFADDREQVLDLLRRHLLVIVPVD